MVPGYYDILLRAGAKYERLLTITDSGSPVNWTGWSAKLELMDRDGVVLDTILSSELTGDRLELGGVLGTIRIYMPVTDVDARIDDLVAGAGRYTLTMVPPSGVEDSDIYLIGALKVAR